MVDLYLLREEPHPPADIDTEQHEEEEEQTEEGLYCKHCGLQITTLRHAIEVNGQHHHTFFNPAGIIYEIRCFRAAPGCSRYGPESSEFTWFAGFTWQITICSACEVHLGWYFSSPHADFFGLIRKNLKS